MINSPIKYYGGKHYMLDEIYAMFPNDYSVFIDGFGGSGVVSLNANTVGKTHIYNDLGKNVYSLFNIISNENTMNNLKIRLELTPYSEDLRKEYILKLKGDLSEFDRAYYYFYVNRTSFNGVGGLSVNPIIRRGLSKSVSDYLSSIEGLCDIYCKIKFMVIMNRDCFDLLNDFDDENTFFFILTHRMLNQLD